jgi:NAD(P)-dependent dehydrogenase (short-subunit alcohol dehydrogenase family)
MRRWHDNLAEVMSRLRLGVRHFSQDEERHAQVLQSAGQQPTRSVTLDEAEARKILTAWSPLGVPWIEPAAVAPVVVFLASNAARMVSGTAYDVTGGDSANNTA